MMKRTTAAMYCDLSEAEFEREVMDGRLPTPIRFGNAPHWNRHAIDEMLGRLVGDHVPDWREKSPLYAKAS